MRPGNGPYASNPDYYNRYKVTVNMTQKMHENLILFAQKEGLNRHKFMLKLLDEGIMEREKRELRE